MAAFDSDNGIVEDEQAAHGVAYRICDDLLQRLGDNDGFIMERDKL